MIGRITGTLLEITPPTVCIETGGIGYEIDVPMSTLYTLPAAGQTASLYTHLAIREDAHVLYGFSSPQERMAFRALIKVTGIGARTALSLLSGMSVQDLSAAISLQDSSRLVKVPGIGKKTAERLLLELRGKLGADLDISPAGRAIHAQDDVLNALLALGYSSSESQKALKALPEGLDVAESIRHALKGLSRA